MTRFTGLTGLSGALPQTPSTNNLVNPIQNNLCVSAPLREEKSGVFTSAVADVYDRNGILLGTKTIVSYDGLKVINDWIVQFASNDYSDKSMGTVLAVANDFQHRNTINLCEPNKPWNHQFQWQVLPENVLQSSIYFVVRLCIKADWLNDRDQFLFPNDGWKSDAAFQGDCLIYALFHGQNRISSRDGVNHWIPFTEAEVDAKERFASHFMSAFLNKHTDWLRSNDLRDSEKASDVSREQIRVLNLSPAARAVLDAGRRLWRYYHAQPNANPNASFYDIRLHFQGAAVDAKGKAKMNSSSADEAYTSLLADLRAVLKNLAKAIEPKVYEYGLLKK